ncbi:MAG TPA: hypothetical protein VMV44_05735 [Rectinemataceae bacterium]|nr:hypothetical protein [Rectinemataceae bacterium]
MNPARRALLATLILGVLASGPFAPRCRAAEGLPPAQSSADSFAVAAPPGTAVLEEGPDRVRGLPFFAPNAIPALWGRYVLGNTDVVIWYTREILVFGKDWSPDPAWIAGKAYQALKTPGAGEGLDLALRMSGWTLIFELPSSDPASRRFVAAFVDRFGFFLSNARSEADLSFPATVAY